MKTFKNFINETTEKLTTKEDIQKWLDDMDIRKYTINSDLTVDVATDVFTLADKHLINIPIKFGKVEGDFDCNGNRISSLEGCPDEVEGDFHCSDNLLNSLKGCPSKVGRNFYCVMNYLTSLKGCPKEINGAFICNHNRINSLEEGPEKVSGVFNCSHNLLKNLKGAPKYIGGSFLFYDNPITDDTIYSKVIGKIVK